MGLFPSFDAWSLLPSFLRQFIHYFANCVWSRMRFSTSLPLGLVTSAVATNLYVSSYIGTITSLKLEEDGLAAYSLKTTFVNNNTTPQPSWLEKVGNVVYCENPAQGSPSSQLTG